LFVETPRKFITEIIIIYNNINYYYYLLFITKQLYI
jgi:hypothetical protein